MTHKRQKGANHWTNKVHTDAQWNQMVLSPGRPSQLPHARAAGSAAAIKAGMPRIENQHECHGLRFWMIGITS